MDLIKQIEAKLDRQERLTEADALALFEHPDLVGIGRLADRVNQARNGGRVFYNVNRHINPTNICALSCKFCSFSRKPGDEGAYAYEMDEIIAKAGEAVKQGATEVHMVGGLHPRWTFKKYVEILAGLKAVYPQLHLKAFTAVELDWMARRDRRTVEEILGDLVAAGLGSLPGGGAEIFHPEIRDQICDTKVSAERWVEIHRMAHGLGLRSNATMLYGHIESFAHRVDHMRRLRDLQDETGGFNAFIPLSFQPHDNEMGIDRYTYGFDDLKTIAVARLFLDNFGSIKAYWVMLGQDIAQLALHFGANDLDGTVTEEKISRMAGGRAGIVMSRNEIEELIRRADRLPVERDTLYRPLFDAGDDPRMAEAAVAARKDLFGRSAATIAQGMAISAAEGKALARQFSLAELAALAALRRPRPIPAHVAVRWESPVLSENSADLTVALAVGDPSPYGVAWDDFAQDCARLATESLLGSPVRRVRLVTGGAVMMPTDYFKAVSLARAMLPANMVIISPLSEIPSLRGVGGSSGGARNQHPVLKIAPLAAHFGADDLGTLSAEIADGDTLCEELRSAGLAVAAGGDPAPGADWVDVLRRHQPLMTAR